MYGFHPPAGTVIRFSTLNYKKTDFEEHPIVETIYNFGPLSGFKGAFLFSKNKNIFNI